MLFELTTGSYTLQYIDLWMLLPMELERGIKSASIDVCYEAIDQKFDCECDCYAILHLHLLLAVTLLKSALKVLCF